MPLNSRPSLRTHRTVAAFLLLATGLAKFIGVNQFWAEEPTFDPVFMLPTHWLMILVGLTEISTAVYCLLNRNEGRAHMLIAWLGVCFLLYRSALVVVGANIRCPCFGTVISRLPIHGIWVDTFLWVAIGYLLAVGLAPLVPIQTPDQKPIIT